MSTPSSITAIAADLEAALKEIESHAAAVAQAESTLQDLRARHAHAVEKVKELYSRFNSQMGHFAAVTTAPVSYRA